MRCGVGVQTWGQKSIKFLYVRRSWQLEGFCAELGVEARCYNLSPSSTSSTAQICYITWLLKGYWMISRTGPLTCVLVKPCFGSPVHFITKGQTFFFFFQLSCHPQCLCFPYTIHTRTIQLLVFTKHLLYFKPWKGRDEHSTILTPEA